MRRGHYSGARYPLNFTRLIKGRRSAGYRTVSCLCHDQGASSGDVSVPIFPHRFRNRPITYG
jgi:hypothetical protein